MFPKEEYAECNGQYFKYTTKYEAIDECRTDDSCDGIIGGPISSSGDTCNDEDTVFHLCKSLRVMNTPTTPGCFLKKRYGINIFRRNHFLKV